jgi:signal transduction histidine kinase
MYRNVGSAGLGVAMARREFEVALRLLTRVRGTLPQGRSLPDDVWQGRHRAILFILWLHVPALVAVAFIAHDGLDAASGIVVVAASAALATAPWGGRRWRSALATVGLLSASCVLVGMGGGTVELAFHFFVTIALVMLYQDGFPFLIAVGFVAVYAVVSAVLESLGIWPAADTWSSPWLRAAVGELLILATATANLANWRLNEDSRAEAERSFQQLYDGQRAVVRELQQSQRLKDELYNVVSHELRTPLTGILGFGELLLARDDRLSAEQRKEHLGRVMREARRLQRVVDNLVYSSKVIQQDGSAAADLRGVVGAVVEDLDDVPGRERLDLQVDLLAAREVAMPAEALRLVMVNLLGNALKYATPLTTVGVVARPAGPDMLAVSVTNAGPPITAADRERIFEPFVQLDSSLTRSASGVGLGLHIVRRLVDSYGGTVDVESAGGLVTFTIVIPAVLSVPADDAPDQEPAAVGARHQPND